MTPMQLVQNVRRLASCAIGRHVTLLGLMPIRHGSEKEDESTVPELFESVCTKDLELRWAAPSSNCDQSQTLFTNNEVSMNHKCTLQNVHCGVSSAVMLP